MKTYFIYKHTSPSGKVYIGQTCKPIPNNRWQNGNGYIGSPLFYNAIQKYGWDNIKHEILFEGLTKEEADRIEIEQIAFYKERGISYNIAIGGGIVGIPCSDETKLKISKSNRGKKKSAESRKKMSESHKGLVIRTGPHSEETKLKISNSLKGRKMSADAYQKMMATIRARGHGFMYGKKMSMESRQKISNSLRGRKLTNLTKERQSKSHLGKKYGPQSIEHVQKLSVTRKNRTWINNGQITKRIKNAQLEAYLENGWVRGRIQWKKK